MHLTQSESAVSLEFPPFTSSSYKSCLKTQAWAMRGKGLSVSNALAPSAPEGDHKLGCLMSTQPDSWAGGVWHTVIVSQPFIWDAAHHVRPVIYCYGTSLLGPSDGELAVCLSFMLTVHSLDKFSRPVWSHKIWCHGCWKQFVFSATDCPGRACNRFNKS